MSVRPTIKHLLIIDDEEGPRLSLELLFEGEFTITTASSGLKALKLLQEQQFPIVITDLLMPDMSGIEVLEEVKLRSPNTEVILITAYGTLDSAQRAIALGVSGYVQKPFDVGHIREVVMGSYENYIRKG